MNPNSSQASSQFLLPHWSVTQVLSLCRVCSKMPEMFSPSEMTKTASSFFSAYASFVAAIMLVKSMANELIPQQLRSFLYSAFQYLFNAPSSDMTIIIEEHCSMTRNEVYEAAQRYLRTRISPDTARIKLGKTERQKDFTITIEKGEEIIDFFENVRLKWRFDSTQPRDENRGYGETKQFFQLTFDKKFREKVLNSYFPHVMSEVKKIKEQEKVVKIYNRDYQHNYDDDDSVWGWGSMNLDHPATFDTIATDPGLKKMIIDDLDRFVRRKEYYKRVGKAWKRGYLLYGPPGTGKSSLIAAIANYLKFDIFDLELANICSDSDLRSVLLSTKNRSILVIEDIDCSVQVQDREMGHDSSGSKLTLSGILNFMDGLWSSCGDERIIIFTTNHKDRLDPALLRPGRMDVHINLSYCTVQGFELLAANYLGIKDKSHPLFGEIDGLIQRVQVTPAEVAEELMKADDVDVALQGIVNFLKSKRSELNDSNEEQVTPKGTDNDTEVEEAEILRSDDDEKNLVVRINTSNVVPRVRRRSKRESRVD